MRRLSLLLLLLTGFAAVPSAGKSQSVAIRTLIEAGIPVKQDTHSGLMHLKMTMADKAVVTTGSFNYSAAAATTNDEVLVVIADAAMAQNWAAAVPTHVG